MQGIYYKTLSRNEYSGETWFMFQPDTPCEQCIDGLVRCKGIIKPHTYKIPLTLIGHFDNDVFVVEEEKLSLTNKNTMVNFILSVNNITSAQAQKIAKSVDDLFDCDETELQENVLKIVKDDGEQLLRKIALLKEHDSFFRELICFGISYDQIERLLDAGINKAQVKRNPYILVKYDIDIYVADEIAKQWLNIDAFSTKRIRAFIWRAMKCIVSNGHSYAPIDLLLKTTNCFLRKSFYSEDLISVTMLLYFLSDEYILVDEKIYFKKIREEEVRLAKEITRINTSKSNTDIIISAPDGCTDEQGNVINMLSTTGVKILTGPPGSGKTTTIKWIIDMFAKKYPKKRISLAATTGRAAKVMGDACKKRAKTVHKMLDIRPFGETIISKNENNPLDADLIIVDEVSQLSLSLAVNLFRAIKSNAIVILVGDEDQLKSVEYGNVLHDLLDCIETYRLTQSIRNTKDIYDNAQRIKKGEDIQENNAVKIIEGSTEEILSSIVKEYKKGDLVVTPTNKGLLGTFNINKEIQKHVHNEELCLSYNVTDYYVGDPVIMEQTNYEKGYFNGSIGVIKGISAGGILVQFDDIVIELDKRDYFFMNLAYAITIHKSQGSESETVHLSMPDYCKNMLNRSLLYTAFTRGKLQVNVFSVESSYKTAIKNITPLRYSGLRELISNI